MPRILALHRRTMVHPIVLVALLVLPSSGCTSGVAPPGPFVAQETARSIGEGKTRVDFSAGGGGGGCCGWVGGAAGGQARVRRGVSDSVEVGGSASAAWYTPHHDFQWAPVNTGPLTLAAQADVKVTLEDRVALVFNGGGGMSPVGAFITGATALVVGDPTPAKVEPYGQLRLAFSAPVGATGFIPDESPGTVDPAIFFLGAVGVLVHLDDRIAMAFEGGGGGIFSRTHGGAGYATIGVQLALGGDG
jgi:hypothetical protein